MRWKNAWILMRKDLDEFKKQKFVIGSIVAMPIVLGVVLPVVMFVPMLTLAPTGEVWDVDGLLEIGSPQDSYGEPWTNQTFHNVSLSSSIFENAALENVQLDDVVLLSCSIKNSNISNATIRDSMLENVQLHNVVVIESEGNKLDGKNILAVDSDIAFTKKKASEIQKVLPLMLNMILMIFMVLPATLPTIIASYSIVGEKNNRSLEPLLATPTSDGEILAGKIFSSFLPSMGATLFAFCLSVIILNIVLIPKIGYPPLPTLSWILSILFVAPTACIMSVLACVLVSSKVTDVRAAQQVGGFVVMPVVVLMLGVLSGFLLLSPLMIFAVAGIYGCIDLGLFYFTRAIFNREDILVKWA